jgi:protein tyrosine kinase modulator
MPFGSHGTAIRGVDDDKAVDNFEKGHSVELVRKSNVIHLAYIASDPKTATDMLSRLLAAFLAKQREIAQPPGNGKVFCG